MDRVSNPDGRYLNRPGRELNPDRWNALSLPHQGPRKTRSAGKQTRSLGPPKGPRASQSKRKMILICRNSYPAQSSQGFCLDPNFLLHPSFLTLTRPQTLTGEAQAVTPVLLFAVP